MARRTYRFHYSQDGAEDYLSEIPLDAMEAYEVLSMSALIHAAVGWDVTLSGNGFTAVKAGVRRSERLVPVTEDGEREPLRLVPPLVPEAVPA